MKKLIFLIIVSFNAWPQSRLHPPLISSPPPPPEELESITLPENERERQEERYESESKVIEGQDASTGAALGGGKKEIKNNQNTKK